MTHIDFTNLNKACPKDSFPLPRIDKLVDAITGHELLSFMGTYSGYNQIRLNLMKNTPLSSSIVACIIKRPRPLAKKMLELHIKGW